MVVDDAAVVVVVAVDDVEAPGRVVVGTVEGALTEVETEAFAAMAAEVATEGTGAVVATDPTLDEAGVSAAVVGATTLEDGVAPGSVLDAIGPSVADEGGAAGVVALATGDGTGAGLKVEVGAGGVVTSRAAGFGEDGSAANAGAAARVAVATMDEMVSRARRDMTC